jgi:hypothetical protein
MKNREIDIQTLPLTTPPEQVWSQVSDDPTLNAVIAKMKTRYRKNHINVKRRKGNIIETEHNYHIAYYKEVKNES